MELIKSLFLRIFLYKMIKHITLLSLFIAFSFGGNAQTVLFEEDFTDGIPATWTLYNEDGLSPATAVAEFTEAWIGKIYGEDTCAASTSYYDPTGQASDYLVTPKLSIGNFSKLVWSARSVDASFPDGYYVLISATDSLVGSFTDTLYTVLAESGSFNDRSVELDVNGYANQDVYIAFKNATENGFILLLNDVILLGAETAEISDYNVTSSQITVYPNPTSDFIQVKTTETINQVSIFSVSGQHILTSTDSQIAVDGLANGTYFISVITNSGQETIQFVKN